MHAAYLSTAGRPRAVRHRDRSVWASYMIKLDPRRCIGCGACEVQCQVKNRTPAGRAPRRWCCTAWRCRPRTRSRE
ncbi:MAG: 4Fe-4S binding protein [Desulfomicrobium escambiense]|nr:4Fe-4S binding protein [Desulfomicrobium escambiense]